MIIAFQKMQALGNDFVILNAIAQDFLEEIIDSAFIKNIADRHLGVGCDQVLVIKNSSCADIAMSIYNPDASHAMACGNGARCVASLWMEKTQKSLISIQVCERVLRAWKSTESNQFSQKRSEEKLQDRPNISVDMSQPTFDASLTKKIQEKIPATFVSLGNPHIVVERSVDDLDFVVNAASKIFPDGVNIEWLTVIDEHCISIDIHERGVGPTNACGTGACAAAVVAISKGYCKSPVVVSMQGGDVRVDFDETIVLTGGTSFVFEGKIDYSPACTTSPVE
ncbi:MAG: diaminopimelate epimerase [Holosporales bacterium]|jgi:diaminopimelate epimerase|nr:diaminopimelate epimerase [Holosporales bacterium]